jgi:hypothetical protein
VEIGLTLEQSHSGLLLAERFQLGEIMGHGDISTIYHGQDTILQRPIVVKVVPPEYIAAYQEALQVTSELTYPAIVATYDVGLLLWQMLSAPSTSTTGDTEGGISPKRIFREDVSEPIRELIWRCLDAQHPRAIKDAESLALALELEVVAAQGDHAPLSELTPPALRAAREVVAHKASWSTEDTIGALLPRPSTPIQGQGRGSRQNPGSLTEDRTRPLAKVATKDPIVQPRLRLPSRSYDASASVYQPDAPGWLEQEDVTQPESQTASGEGTRSRPAGPEVAGVGPRTALSLGMVLFVLAFVIGYFLVAMLGSH